MRSQRKESVARCVPRSAKPAPEVSPTAPPPIHRASFLSHFSPSSSSSRWRGRPHGNGARSCFYHYYWHRISSSPRRLRTEFPAGPRLVLQRRRSAAGKRRGGRESVVEWVRTSPPAVSLRRQPRRTLRSATALLDAGARARRVAGVLCCGLLHSADDGASRRSDLRGARACVFAPDRAAGRSLCVSRKPLLERTPHCPMCVRPAAGWAEPRRSRRCHPLRRHHRRLGRGAGPGGRRAGWLRGWC